MLSTCKKNWFNTLSEALESEGLQDYWSNYNISYGETARQSCKVENVRFMKHMIIFREINGMYERPVHYFL